MTMRATRNASPITIDASATLIVITCTEHSYWSAARFHEDEALDCACAHEEREHAGERDVWRSIRRRVAHA